MSTYGDGGMMAEFAMLGVATSFWGGGQTGGAGRDDWQERGGDGSDKLYVGYRYSGGWVSGLFFFGLWRVWLGWCAGLWKSGRVSSVRHAACRGGMKLLPLLPQLPLIHSALTWGWRTHGGVA